MTAEALIGLRFVGTPKHATALVDRVSDVKRMAAPREPDREDVHRVLGGDVEAFSGIVERWQRPLVNLAYEFSGDRSSAEDMAQEAFLRAFQRLDQWREDAAFSTWLFAVALNVYRNATRRHARREAPLEDDCDPAGSDDVLNEVATRREEELVRRAVRLLTRRYREAIVCFYFLDQNVAEAADMLAVPDGTLKARLHRGRALLKPRLARLRGRNVRRRT
jgi:RNA polymerase sigma-70 factor (ECF subfamily)